MTGVWRRVWSQRGAQLALVCLGTLVVLCGLGPVLWNSDPALVALDRLLLPAGSAGHPLGTDELGRDELVRLLVGGRISLVVALVVALGVTVLGTAVGMLAAYAGGVVRVVLMRLVDAALCVPLLPLLMVLSALQASRGAAGIPTLMLLLVALGWMGVARQAYAATRQWMTADFVLASRALGANGWHVVRFHLLPNVLPGVLVAATLEVATVLLYEAALSFLGLGVKPPTPSWGNMLTNAQELMHRAPLLALWPGLFILVTVGSINVLGDALRRALDPRQSDVGLDG
jgi:peptide/nickel transport system permease protein